MPETSLPGAAGSSKRALSGEARPQRARRARSAGLAPRKATSPQPELSPEDETDVRLGPDCQAEVPDASAVRPRPAQLSADERRWVSGRIHVPPARPQTAVSSFPYGGPAPETAEARRHWIEEARRALHRRLDPGAQPATGSGQAAPRSVSDLGLDRLGSALCALYSPAEEAAISEAMGRHGRDFGTIVRRCLGHRTVPDLVLYYYNVLKTGATPAARAWRLEEASRKGEGAKEQVSGGSTGPARSARAASKKEPRQR